MEYNHRGRVNSRNLFSMNNSHLSEVYSGWFAKPVFGLPIILAGLVGMFGNVGPLVYASFAFIMRELESSFGWSRSSMTLSISLLTLVFAALVAYKVDWDYKAFFGDVMETPVEEKAQDIPEDEDYQLIHYVNVSFANIREQPSKESKIVGGAGKGERLIILEKGEHWTQVDMGGKKGWVATRLLSTSIE